MCADSNKPGGVVVASASVGTGHNQAARAVLAGLQQADPSIRAEWVDVLDRSNPLFRLYYAGGYATMVSRAPRLYGLGYRITDRPRGPRRSLPERRRLLTERWAVRRFTRWLLARRPAVVVSTHFLIPPVVGRLIAQGAGGLRQMVVVTDHHMHRFWCSEQVERFFVPDQAGCDRLIDFGVAADRIDIAGIPIHPKWIAPADAAAARATWDLPAGRPVILISAGVNFTVGHVDRLAQRLCARLPGATVVVAAGTNTKLLARLAAMPEAGGDSPQLRPIGFTDRFCDLVRLADVVITKAGGMTVTECVTAAAAMVVLDPIPGQEAFNAQWLSDHGAAIIADGVDDVVAQTVSLVGDPQRIARLRASAGRLATPATETIVGHILDQISRL